jgi:hypothetical protein
VVEYLLHHQSKVKGSKPNTAIGPGKEYGNWAIKSKNKLANCDRIMVEYLPPHQSRVKGSKPTTLLSGRQYGKKI